VSDTSLRRPGEHAIIWAGRLDLERTIADPTGHGERQSARVIDLFTHEVIA
jgi:hypothetical protein